MTGEAHARVWALIPWLVNGRADARQRADAERHLAQCAGCRAELDAQRRLRQALQHDAAPAAAPDAEAGLQRLFARLDQAPDEPAAPATHRPRRWLPAALAAAVAIQAVGLALLSWRLRDADDARYAVLSQPGATAGVAALRVVPDPGLPLQQWQALLQEHHLRIVDGPNSAGAYALAPRDGAVPTPALLERLRAAPGIRFAEAVAP